MRGLTLLEVLVYLSLFSLLLTGLLPSFIVLHQSGDRLESRARLIDGEITLITSIEADIETGIGQSSIDSGRLLIPSSGGDVLYYSADGTVVREKDGQADAVTMPDINVESISFSSEGNSIQIHALLVTRTRSGILVRHESKASMPLEL